MMGVNVHDSIDLSNNGGGNIPGIMRDRCSSESISSGEFFLFSFHSQNNGGMNNSSMIYDSINMSLRGGHFRGDKSGGFGGNIFEHSEEISSAGLSFIEPSVDAIGGADGIVLVSRHTSAGNFTPSAVDISGTEITRLDSQTHFVVREILNITGGVISERGVDDFGDYFVINVSSVGDSGVLHDQSGLGTVRGGFGLGSEMLVKSHSFGGNGQHTDSIVSSGSGFGLGFGTGSGSFHGFEGGVQFVFHFLFDSMGSVVVLFMGSSMESGVTGNSHRD